MPRTLFVLACIAVGVLACGTAQAAVSVKFENKGTLLDGPDGDPIAAGSQTFAVVDRDGDGYGDFEPNNFPANEFPFDDDDWLITDVDTGQAWDEVTGTTLGGSFLTTETYKFLLESDSSGDGITGVNPGDPMYLFYFIAAGDSPVAADAATAPFADGPGYGQSFGVFQFDVVPENGGGFTYGISRSPDEFENGVPAEYGSTAIPEPASGLLLLLGGAGAAIGRRRNRASA